MKVRRNQPCPCGSGKKYKRCCGSLAGPTVQPRPDPAHLQHVFDLMQAQERIREAQQGRGRPIISADLADHKIVAVGKTVYWGKNWKTFGDFLQHYIKTKLGTDWGNAEIVKPLADRHPIMQWYDALCHYQRATIKVPGQVSAAEVTGLVACYMGLAYGLYLLDHNVELQARLIHRLKDAANFQGAYYEVVVARLLIRAGFTLALEDETNPEFKHCEFSATSKIGKKYWVEAKMRAIAGVLGRTPADGGADTKPIKRLVPHLNAAFAKPADAARLIFVDLNTSEGLDDPENTRWHPAAIERLQSYETNELREGDSAYLFVTNVAYHRQLDRPPICAALPFGLGSDFEKPGTFRLGDAYRRKRRHSDAYDILASFEQDTSFPATFDGSLPSETFGGSRRPIIGETRAFEGAGERGTVGTVDAATVNDQNGEFFVGISDQTGGRQILKGSLSADELADYKRHPDAYFGKVTSSGRRTNSPDELFEWLMDANKAMSRASMLEWFSSHRRRDELDKLSDEDLLIEYCEGHVAAMSAMQPKAT